MIEKQSNEIKTIKGGKRDGAGRKPGTPNKLSGAVKDNIVSVFDQIGGVDTMAEWASENKTQFFQLYAKLLPLQVNGAGPNGEHTISGIKIEFVKPSGD